MFGLCHVQALAQIFKNSETGYFLVFKTWNGYDKSFFQSNIDPNMKS